MLYAIFLIPPPKKSRWWQLKYFFMFNPFQPYLGKWSILTNIFQMGWNHQLEQKYLPSPKWMVKIREIPIKIDDLGCFPLFLETPKYSNPKLTARTWKLMVGRPIFRCELLVSGRVFKTPVHWCKTSIWMYYINISIGFQQKKHKHQCWIGKQHHHLGNCSQVCQAFHWSCFFFF